MTMQALLFIDGQWREGRGTGETIKVINPATEAVVGTATRASAGDLDDALAAAARGFAIWSETPAHKRTGILRDACRLMRERADEIAKILSREQGKPVPEARGEILTSVENLEWMAEEATRAYGRFLPARADGVGQTVRRYPIGPVAAFTPWNFPALTPLRKMAGSLASGCSLILKPAEETPFTAIELVKAFADAGLPAGVLNLVLGDPPMISEHLISSPVIRKVTFTGSTRVGKMLAAKAAANAKRSTMELGGHAPVIVCDDVDVEAAAKMAVSSKFRNAGQVCTSPTRFFVQSGVYEPFIEAFAAAAADVKVGPGDQADVAMGPLANSRQLASIEQFVADTAGSGARLVTGGNRIGNQGYFYQPTVFADVPDTARIMQEEPFGPVVPFQPFDDFDDVLARANNTPFGLAGYVMTRSLLRSEELSDGIEAGMVVVNHFSVSTPYSPFGGVKESGDGLEGGIEGLEAYLVSKTITTRYA